MPLVSRNLAQRSQHKSTRMHSRVRNLQAGLADALFPEEQQIQIQLAGAPAFGLVGSIAARFPLQQQKKLEKGPRIEFGLDGHNGIQIPVLARGPDRLGFPKTGRRPNPRLRVGIQSFASGHERSGPITKIRAKSDPGLLPLFHWCLSPARKSESRA